MHTHTHFRTYTHAFCAVADSASAERAARFNLFCVSYGCTSFALGLKRELFVGVLAQSCSTLPVHNVTHIYTYIVYRLAYVRASLDARAPQVIRLQFTLLFFIRLGAINVPMILRTERAPGFRECTHRDRELENVCAHTHTHIHAPVTIVYMGKCAPHRTAPQMCVRIDVGPMRSHVRRHSGSDCCYFGRVASGKCVFWSRRLCVSFRKYFECDKEF